MHTIRIHGRAGQGVVSAVYLLAYAAFECFKHTQAFPMFGAERRGAPLEAYCRIDNKPIKLRSQAYDPDVLIIIDPTLYSLAVKDLKTKTIIIVNTTKELKSKRHKIYTLDAKKMATTVFGKPIYNTIMLAAFGKHTKLITKKGLKKAIDMTWKGSIVEKNKKAVDMVWK